jgi:peptide/nickel transport system ATP-binding protein
MTGDPLLSVRGLEKHYPITEGLLRREVGRVRAVDGIDLDVKRGETLGLVGESGSGKTTAALSLLRLEEPTAGEVYFDGEEVTAYGERELLRFRRRAQLVLQDPDSAFNPRMTVGRAVGEPLKLHGLHDGAERRAVVEDALDRVGLDPDAADRHPDTFSGGERQRIAIARALVLTPELIVADEPVSALDGRVRNRVLSLLSEIQAAFDLSLLFVSHDIDVVRRICDRVAVMYLGEIVERGPTEDVLSDPKHPYTRLLVDSVPSLDPSDPAPETAESTLEPDPADPPAGCSFHPRCPVVVPPAGSVIPDDRWQALVDLRARLDADAVDPERPAASLGAVGGNGQGTAEMRATLGLPDSLADDRLESALSESLAALESGEIEPAREALSGVVTSVCTRDEPSLVEGDTSRPVACHRYDPSVEDEPVERGT